MLSGNYLITGSCGLVGSSVIKLLAGKKGINVIGTVHHSEPEIFADNIRYINIDLCKQSLDALKDEIDYVFMFAGIVFPFHVLSKEPINLITDHLLMSLKTLEFSYRNGVKKVLYLSSCTGYPYKIRLYENDMFIDDPVDKYFSIGWTTRYIEKMCEMYSLHCSRNMPVVVVRPTSIYGEKEGFDINKCHILPMLVKNVVDRSSPIKIFGSGKNCKDLIHANDVVDACFLAFENSNEFNIFNVGGSRHSINELLGLIMNIEKCSMDIEYEHNDTPTQTNVVDLSKILGLGFVPSIDINKGISMLIDKYKSTIGRE